MKLQCPNCQKMLKVPDHLQGKTVRCPAKDCGARITVPADPLPQEEVGLKLAEEEPPARPSVAPVYPGTLQTSSHTPYLEVRVDEEKVEYMDLGKVRKLLLQGVLSRHTKVRWVEAEPQAHEFAEEQASFREVRLDAARKRWRKRQQWRSIGESLAVEEPDIDGLYRLRIQPAEDVAAMGSSILALTVLVGIIGWLIWFLAANTSVSEGDGSESGNGSGFWEALAEGNLHGAWQSYQSTILVFVLLLVAMMVVLIGIAAAVGAVYKVSNPIIAWSVGCAHHVQRLRSWERPPDDGYQD